MIEIEYLSIIISIAISLYIAAYLVKYGFVVLEQKKLAKKLDKVLENESMEDFQQELINIALHKLKSSNIENKVLAINQLSYFPNRIAYYAFLDALRKENNKLIQELLIRRLCRIIQEKRKD